MDINSNGRDGRTTSTRYRIFPIFHNTILVRLTSTDPDEGTDLFGTCILFTPLCTGVWFLKGLALLMPLGSLSSCLAFPRGKFVAIGDEKLIQ